ncbi:MAG TPA: hypothetical protein VJ715_06795 [Pyrinomonadaceae bacterium]|nr:hypothetical protein [Pyrinomonadaceae bacterium]
MSILLLFVIVCGPYGTESQVRTTRGYIQSQAPTVRLEDLGQLTGEPWAGSLTYLDYRSNKKVSIPSNLTVTRVPGEEMSWVFEYQYPDEPQANSKQTVTITEGGTVIDGEKVIERTALDGGALKLVTERTGSDNDRKALFRYTYLLGPSTFSIKKEVRPEGAAAFFERNEYSWKR